MAVDHMVLAVVGHRAAVVDRIVVPAAVDRPGVHIGMVVAYMVVAYMVARWLVDQS